MTERVDSSKIENEENKISKAHKRVKNAVCGYFHHPETIPCEYLPHKYSYIFRRKSRWELTRISAIVTGIEFGYAAETAYVTPVLLSLGLNVKYVSMIWCLSPLLAFILTPILGSFSDSCNSRFGRRRPFIFMLSMGIIIGLVFVPYGGRLGILLGDIPDNQIKTDVGNDTHEKYSLNLTNNSAPQTSKLSLLQNIKTVMLSSNLVINDSVINSTVFYEGENIYSSRESLANISDFERATAFNETSNHEDENQFKTSSRVYGILITVIGTVFLDFCADVCQSPCRSYLLDITLPEDHAAGLTIFCLNSGIGSAVGYAIAAIKWDVRLWGNILEGQVVVAFAIISVMYLLLFSSSLYSFPEIPLPLLKDTLMFKEYQTKTKDQTEGGTEMSVLSKDKTEYSTMKDNGIGSAPNCKNIPGENGTIEIRRSNSVIKTSTGSCPEEPLSSPQTGLKEYLKSIIFMPKSLRILCLTNFFYGMGIISYSLFFTDFVGECVFGGNPRAPKDSKSYELYKDGVRFGCWGMAFCCISCSVYSGAVENLAERFGAKIVFVGGALVYSAGMVLMAVIRHKVAVIILSSTAGIMFTTLATLPYILVAHYHTSHKFQENSKSDDDCTRGLGTDVATVISVIVLSQCILSFAMGSVVDAIGSNVVTVCSAALFSACGAISATQVMYLDK